MRIIHKLKRKLVAICMVCMFLTTVTGMALLKTNVSAESLKLTSMTLCGEIAKITYTQEELEESGLDENSFKTGGATLQVSDELKALYQKAFAKSDLRFYTSSFYYTQIHNYEYYQWLDETERWPVSYSAINGLGVGHIIGTEYGFKQSGNYTVGEGGSHNVWIVGWTAPADGTLVLPATSLTINSATNATLNMAWTKGSYMQAKTTEGWTEYATSTTIAEQSFEVAKGESVYLSLYAAGTENRRKVNIGYNPTFNFYEDVKETEEDSVTKIVGKDEIAKVQSIETISTDTALSFYMGIQWEGYSQQAYSVAGGAANYSSINTGTKVLSAAPLYNISGTNNTVFSSTGTHTVGSLGGEANARTWAIGYTAPKKGVVVIPAKRLSVLAEESFDDSRYDYTYKSTLFMGISKGAQDRKNMSPEDNSLKWKKYEAGKDYIIPEQRFQVEAGEVVYINLYSLYSPKSSDESLDTEENFVTFTYDFTFKFIEMVDGISFATDTTYATTKKLSSVPLTLEAEVYLPSSLTEQGGIIFGNYIGDAGALFFNFEIHTNGQVRLLYKSDDYAGDAGIVFKKTDVRQDRWVHVAVTYDASAGSYGGWTCYIDGQYADSATYLAYPISSGVLNRLFRIGGDYRSGNSVYFKGHLRSLAIYSDMRDANEIESDKTNGVNTTDSNLLAYYQTPLIDAGTNIADLSQNKNNLHYMSTWFKNKDEVTGYSYSFAVVGDTQKLIDYDINNGTTHLSTMYDWILSNKDSKKIEHVFGLGDITDWSNTEEWEYAKSVISRMDGEVLYSLIRGNHDTSGDFNETFYYDAYTNQFGGFYQEGSILNSWMAFTAGETDYLLVTLDFGPSDEVLKWAGDVIKSFPDRRVIVSTHAYLDANGNKNTLSDSAFNTLDYDVDQGFVQAGTKQYNNGVQIWEKLISQHSNIFLVMGGHDPSSNVVCRQSKGIYGNTVTELLIDPQDMDKTMTPVGMVAMLYFSEDGTQIEVEWYSTIREEFYLESNQYTIDISNWETPTQFVGHNLTLDGSIGVNFYANISDDIANDQNSYVLLTMDNQILKAPVVGAKVTSGEQAGTYRFQFRVAAAEMTKKIKAQLYTGDDVPVGFSATASVQKYAEYTIKNSTNAKLVTLMKAMLNYGAESQKLFNVETTTLANVNLSETDKNIEAGSTVVLPELGGDMIVDVDANDGISARSAALILESMTTIRVYFTFSNSANIADYTFKVGENELEMYRNINGYYVDIENVEVANLNKVYTLNVVCSDDTVLTLRYSALHYVQTVLSNPTYFDDALQGTVKALNLYNLAADAYFEQ